MVFASETVEPSGDARIQRVRGAAIAAAEFDAKIAGLRDSVGRRDLSARWTRWWMVPEYEPSELLRARSRSSAPRTK